VPPSPPPTISYIYFIFSDLRVGVLWLSAVEPFHLDRYLDEQMFRFNNRAMRDNPLDDSDRFMLALSQVANRRPTYAELTDKVGKRAQA
jgi:hypothetical protein